ncbi:MAG: type III secretion system translocon subunit SctB [Victivallales bacterium]|nr:type III secretion system translocon subunit SctB [Victivallales bacterium]
MVEGIGNKPIQGGFSNTQGIDGGTNVGGTKETKETKETKGTGLRGQLMTETVEKKNGATGSTTPQLTPPAGNYNAAETANSILNVLGNLSNDDPSKGLFILYQLLALLQRALNEMQQSMQVMRQAETNVAIANIQAEADTISSSAQWSLWLGIASGLVQMGASAFSIYGGIRGVSQTMKAKSTGEQLKTAQAELATLKAADAPDANAIAAKQLEMTGLKTKMDIHLSTANSISTKHQAIGQGVGSVAQFTKAGADGVAGAKQADAKRIEAQTKTMEATANEVADLTKAIKDMLTAILQLMQAVNRNEVDTNAQIMRGI